MTLVVSDIRIYPVKALGGIPVSKAEVTARGFRHDRRMMLVDENGVFISQREVNGLGMLSCSIRGDQLHIAHERRQYRTLTVPLEPTEGERVEVVVWKDRVNAIAMSEQANEWFTYWLNRPARLVYMPDDSRRVIDPDFSKGDEIVSFADGYPYLLIGQASLNELNQRIGKILSIKRFRPNIVFTGGGAFEEDTWDAFRVGDIRFNCIKPCARCIVTTIDPVTSERGTEPLRTLSTYRKEDHKVLFGQNLTVEGTGGLSIGDEIEVVKGRA